MTSDQWTAWYGIVDSLTMYPKAKCDVSSQKRRDAILAINRELLRLQEEVELQKRVRQQAELRLRGENESH